MNKLIAAVALICVAPLMGCATTTEEIVKVGPDTYKFGALPRYADYSNSALKARLQEDAYRHCAAQNRIMVPVAGQNLTNAPAEMQFRCVARNQAQLPSKTTPSL